jgi:hypothetical protein
MKNLLRAMISSPYLQLGQHNLDLASAKWRILRKIKYRRLGFLAIMAALRYPPSLRRRITP